MCGCSGHRLYCDEVVVATLVVVWCGDGVVIMNGVGSDNGDNGSYGVLMILTKVVFL